MCPLLPREMVIGPGAGGGRPPCACNGRRQAASPTLLSHGPFKASRAQPKSAESVKQEPTRAPPRCGRTRCLLERHCDRAEAENPATCSTPNPVTARKRLNARFRRAACPAATSPQPGHGQGGLHAHALPYHQASMPPAPENNRTSSGSRSSRDRRHGLALTAAKPSTAGLRLQRHQRIRPALAHRSTFLHRSGDEP